MPCLLVSSRTSRRFAIEMGCPPAMFTVAATQTYGIRSAPTSSMRAESLSRSMLPLNGCSECESCASSMMMSWNVAPACSWWNRVVVKYMFPGTWSPSLMRLCDRRFSAPRPWCVGTRYCQP